MPKLPRPALLILAAALSVAAPSAAATGFYAGIGCLHTYSKDGTDAYRCAIETVSLEQAYYYFQTGYVRTNVPESDYNPVLHGNNSSVPRDIYLPANLPKADSNSNTARSDGQCAAMRHRYRFIRHGADSVSVISSTEGCGSSRSFESRFEKQGSLVRISHTVKQPEKQSAPPPR